MQPNAVLADHEQSNVVVRLTIEHVSEVGDCFDPGLFGLCEPPDFYAYMEIDGTERTTDHVLNDASINPNWILENSGVVLGSNRADIQIQIWDADSFLRFEDDKGDIDPFDGRNMNGRLSWDWEDFTWAKLTLWGVGPSGSNFTQDLTPNAPEGFLGTPVTFTGGSGNSPPARIRFRVDLLTPPGLPLDDPGDKIRPLGIHSPIYPSVTDTLTITGGVVDEFGQPVNRDTIEIWFDEDGVEPRPSVPIYTCPGVTSSCSTTVDLTTLTDLGSRFAYGIYARDLSTHSPPVWSGWRLSAVDDPDDGVYAVGDVIPISVGTRPMDEAVDILLIPDGIDYFSGGNCISSLPVSAFLTFALFFIDSVECDGAFDSAQWSTDIGVLLGGTIFSSADWSQATASNPGARLAHSDVLLLNQKQINIWYAEVHAVIPRMPDLQNDGHCLVLIPLDFRIQTLAFDVTAVIHRTDFRDCAPPGVFTSEPGNTTTGFNARSLSTFLHELGHSPFGNMDIYCCDGGYLQRNVHPNLYHEREDRPGTPGCDNDPVLGDSGKPAPPANTAPCPEFISKANWDWYRPEPPNSIMGTHNQTDPGTGFYSQYGPSSANRILWYLGKCNNGDC